MTDCPAWCANHRADSPADLVEHIESHGAEPFWLRSPYCDSALLAFTMNVMVVDGEPDDPGIGLYLWPENPDTVPIGMTVRQARLAAEALLHLVEVAEAEMTEPCQGGGCTHRIVPSSAGLCTPCRVAAWRASRPRLVRTPA